MRTELLSRQGIRTELGLAEQNDQMKELRWEEAGTSVASWQEKLRYELWWRWGAENWDFEPVWKKRKEIK